MAIHSMISSVRHWAPAAASGIIVVLTTIATLHTHRIVIHLTPLPAAVHVSSRHIAELSAETRAPLFAPSRSNAPIGADGKAPQMPPPTLTGLVVGAGHAVALVKTAKGETVMAHAGDTIDGWTVVEIAPHAIVVARDGARQTIDLVFGSAKPNGTDASLPASPAAVHGSMASPSFDGLAAIRRRGLPEANIPLGSPLVPQR